MCPLLGSARALGVPPRECFFFAMGMIRAALLAALVCAFVALGAADEYDHRVRVPVLMGRLVQRARSSSTVIRCHFSALVARVLAV